MSEINHPSFLKDIKRTQDECELRQKLDLNCSDCTAILEADSCVLSEIYVLTEKKNKTRKIVPIICENCGAVQGMKEESGKIICGMCGGL